MTVLLNYFDNEVPRYHNTKCTTAHVTGNDKKDYATMKYKQAIDVVICKVRSLGKTHKFQA